jgi:hypothetical protein
MTIAPTRPLKVDQPNVIPDPEWWEDDEPDEPDKDTK